MPSDTVTIVGIVTAPAVASIAAAYLQRQRLAHELHLSNIEDRRALLEEGARLLDDALEAATDARLGRDANFVVIDRDAEAELIFRHARGLAAFTTRLRLRFAMNGDVVARWQEAADAMRALMNLSSDDGPDVHTRGYEAVRVTRGPWLEAARASLEPPPRGRWTTRLRIRRTREP